MGPPKTKSDALCRTGGEAGTFGRAWRRAHPAAGAQDGRPTGPAPRHPGAPKRGAPVHSGLLSPGNPRTTRAAALPFDPLPQVQRASPGLQNPRGHSHSGGTPPQQVAGATPSMRPPT